MPDEKPGVKKDSAVKESGSDGAKAAPDSSPPSKDTEAQARGATQTKAEPNGARTADRTPEQTEETSAPAKHRLNFQRIVPFLILLLAAGILFAIIGGWNRWVGGRSTQKTDDAYLRSDITPLSTRVSGTVQEVAVGDYQRVKAGDLLVQLKDDDYKAQVAQAEAGVAAAQAALENNSKQKDLQGSKIEQAQAGVQAASAEIAQAGAAIEAAKADVANAQAGVDQAQAKIPDSQAAVEAAQAEAERASLERKRQEALVELGSATKQKLEQVVADQESSAAVIKSRKAELAQTRALLDSRRADLSKARAQVALRQAEQQRARSQLSSRTAEVDAQIKQRAVLDAQESQLKADLSAKEEAVTVARTNLEYTRIVAPTDGIVGERKVRIGQLVSPGTQVISLVDNEVWVQANYKETQLTNVIKGDTARITVDTFPGLELKGHVEEISPASGSQFALLPPDNASGNYTKIVQRIPVKILIDHDQNAVDRLRPGMSVIVEINASGKKSGDATAGKEP
jgi:membrane fusion protein, multidrug efflux system